MNIFFTPSKVMWYFYTLLIVSLFGLLDVYFFSFLSQYYDFQLLLIVLALISGIGALLTLNSSNGLFKVIKYHIRQGQCLYKKFTEIFIILISGTLIILPGIITSSIGLILYIKPIRLIVANLVYKKNKELIVKLFSYFLAQSPDT